jgi:iron(III) transport system permease protein
MLVLQTNGYLQQITGINLNDVLFSKSGIVLVMTLNIFPVVYFAVSAACWRAGSVWRW